MRRCGWIGIRPSGRWALAARSRRSAGTETAATNVRITSTADVRENRGKSRNSAATVIRELLIDIRRRAVSTSAPVKTRLALPTLPLSPFPRNKAVEVTEVPYASTVSRSRPLILPIAPCQLAKPIQPYRGAIRRQDTRCHESALRGAHPDAGHPTSQEYRPSHKRRYEPQPIAACGRRPCCTNARANVPFG